MKPYRAIPIDGKEFVYGGLYELDSRAFILQEYDIRIHFFYGVNVLSYNDDPPFSVMFIEVNPKSVGQATGLKDKNGKGEKEVYEGDIVLCSYKETTDPIFRGVITYTPPEFYLACFWESVEGVESFYDVGANNRSLIRGEWQVDEIIGTIHTTPELMEKPK